MHICRNAIRNQIKMDNQLEALAAGLPILQADTQPAWGSLSAQAMLEHLTLGLKIGNGSLSPRGPVPYDDYDDQRKRQLKIFLRSDKPFERNIMNPLMKDKPFQTRKANLEEAKHWFMEELQRFADYWNTHPESVLVHPTLGPMDAAEWLNFERRHIRHHFTQFGLLEELPN
jgi:hypothetical protein